MKTKWLSVATIGLSLVAASEAGASYSLLKTNTNELNVADVFSNLYGGTFEQVGLDFTNGAKTARRVDDETDQTWSGDFDVSIVGRFSGYTQSLAALTGGQFQHLVAAGGIGFAAAPNEVSVTMNAEPFVRYGDSGTHSSVNVQNEDERDHMVTFEVDSGSAARTWVLFWEDLDMGPGVTKGRSISDFNDLVVKLRTADVTNAPPIAVPLPPAFFVGLATLGLSVYFIRRRVA